ncbi:hypothetical protein [Oricola thermophila]|uniref:Tripartite tricarboxylate transporter TctB family protein n=1 Tax=Oricola thermophila TaxID=2742145 RepID=A0A6N1VH80_9HYPH|nr:hypothetical protein [Oricola thermophila]QKV18357.1 hypothetical protein HTY61_07760 [Oricola thermophila]
MPDTDTHRNERPGTSAGPFVECGIILALCAIALFLVIPAGTRESDNFGLSPRMLPDVTVIAIAIFAIVGLLTDLRKGAPKAAKRKGLGGVAALMAATALGVAAIHFAGLTPGGAILVLACSLALGVRQPLRLATMTCAAAALLLLIDWSGI